MTRRRVRMALVGVVVVALAGIAWQTWRSIQRSRGRIVAGVLRDLVPNVTQHIRDFRRIKMKSGRVVWEVEAKEASYFEDEDRVVVTAPRLVVYFEDGARRAELSGREGHLDLTAKDLDMVRLEGGVRLVLDDLEVTTERAVYERGRDVVTAPGRVRVRGQTLDVEATGMEVELGPQRLRLLADVRTTMAVGDAGS